MNDDATTDAPDSPYAAYSDRELLERIAAQNDAFIQLASGTIEQAGPLLEKLGAFADTPKGRLMMKLVPGL